MLGERMREARPSSGMKLRIVADLHGGTLAAVVYGPQGPGFALLRLNRARLTGQDFDAVLSWARREIAQGKHVARLLADELAGLPS